MKPEPLKIPEHYELKDDIAYQNGVDLFCYVCPAKGTIRYEVVNMGPVGHRLKEPAVFKTNSLTEAVAKFNEWI